MSQRILISRMSAIGDTILTLPVACALREQFPDAYLGWVVEEKSSPVVLSHRCLDEVIVLKRGWFTSPAGIRQTRRTLLPKGFDTTVDCQGVTKSALAAWLSGARTRIGYRGKYGCELSTVFNNKLVEPASPHLTDRSLELLSPLGIAEPSIDWMYPLTDAAQTAAGEIIQGLQLGPRFAAINPGASWDSRLWSNERFGQVAQHLGEKHGIPTLVVWGNSREHQWAREIAATSAGYGILAPATSLAVLAALLGKTDIFISPDTGPLHLAVAMGARCISLHGVTRPQDSGPHGSQHIPLQVHFHAGTRRQRRAADNSAMMLISVEMVCNACDQLVKTGARGAAA